MGGPKVSSNKRWRPTGEQVMILRGLFKGGLTTPSAVQIQTITSQLKKYGKVETKNVFYWFQNRKARDKQKMAKKLHLNNSNNNVLYYVYLPTFAISPVFPPQTMSLEKPEIIESYFNGVSKEEGSSTTNVTWFTTEYDEHREGLRTLELFPTTPSSSSSNLSSIFIAN